jgi:flagellar motor component MotA
MKTRIGLIGLMVVVVVGGCAEKSEPGSVQQPAKVNIIETNAGGPSVAATEAESNREIDDGIPSASDVRKEAAATIARVKQLAWEEYKQAADDETREVLELASRHKAKSIGDEAYFAGMLAVEEHYRKERRDLIEREEMSEILVARRMLEKGEMDQPKLEAAARAAEKRAEQAQADLEAFYRTNRR